MLRLDMWRQLVGFLLILVAWLDPFQLGTDFVILAFILGFDSMSLLPKMIIFGLDFLMDVSGLGTFLLILIAEEIIFDFLLVGHVINLVIKPLVVFLILYVNQINIGVAVLVALLDLGLNYTKKLT